MGGTVIAALLDPKLAKHWSLAAPFWVAAALMASTAVVFWLLARDAPAKAQSGGAISFTAPLRIFRRNPRAWALTLFCFLAFGLFAAVALVCLLVLLRFERADGGTAAAGAWLPRRARPAPVGR
jgi:MFS transporter, NNP family, nitrate/nitrite transporter